MANLLETALELHKKGKHEQANNIYEQILEHDQANANAWHLSGLIEISKNNLTDAITKLEQAIQISPKQVEFYCSLAKAYLQNNQIAIALKILHSAQNIDPNNINCLITLGEAYQKNHDSQLALECYNQALIYMPENTVALNNIGAIYAELGEYKVAEEYFNKVLAIVPNDISAMNNLGNLNIQANNFAASIEQYKKILSVQPNNALAKLNLGIAYQAHKDFPNALSIFENLSITDPWVQAKLTTKYALCLAEVCEWERLSPKLSLISKLLSNLHPHENPFIEPLEAYILNLPLPIISKITKLSAAYYHRIFSNLQPTTPIAKVMPKDSKLKKIGYLSQDFGDHPVGMLFNNLSSYHDHNNFLSYGLSLTQHNDSTAMVIQNSFDNFIDLSKTSDLQAIEIINQLDLDILVDLSGQTKGKRPVILAARPAKKIISWLGSFTTGFSEVDFILGSKHQYPVELQEYFTEKILHLDNYVISREPFKVPPNINSLQRSDFGLPQQAVVFAYFGKHYRIDKLLIHCWSKILKSAKNSVLWLQSDNPSSHHNIMEAFAKENISSDKIFFAPPEKLTNRWLHSLADIWLDALNFSSGTATFICAGTNLPFICFKGNTPITRLSYSLAMELEMPELIATTPDEYIAQALNLAHPSNLQQTKLKMQRQVANSSLFKPRQFIASLEKIYQKILLS